MISGFVHIRFYLPVILILIIFSNINAQTGFSSSGGANWLGMARAGVAHTGAASIYLNQAGMTSVHDMAFDISAERRFNLSELTQVSLVAIKSFRFGTVGLVASSFGFDQYNEQKIGFAYARRLSGNISIGGQFDLLRYNIDNIGSKNVFSFETGMIAHINKQITVGAHIFSPVHVKINDIDKISARFRTGLKYSPSNKVFLLAEVDKSIDQDMELRFGISYIPIKTLTLMTGVNTTLSSFHFGLQLHFSDHYSIATALGTNHILGNSPSISLQYQQ